MVCSLIKLYIVNLFYKFVILPNALNGIKITGWFLFIILNYEDIRLHSTVSSNDCFYYTKSTAIHYYVPLPVPEGGSES